VRALCNFKIFYIRVEHGQLLLRGGVLQRTQRGRRRRWPPPGTARAAGAAGSPRPPLQICG
jgi:hypothetical protein